MAALGVYIPERWRMQTPRSGWASWRDKRARATARWRTSGGSNCFAKCLGGCRARRYADARGRARRPSTSAP
eukprot:6198210-Pleurochrysis_carterae.AAC.1